MNYQNIGLKRCWSLRMAALVALAAFSLGAQAESAIEAVSGSMQSGTEVVKIDLTEELATAPAGFVIQSPASITLDFPGVGSSMGRAVTELNQGNVRSFRVLQAGERSRVVLNLKQATNYKLQVQGKSLLVFLDPPATAAPAAAASAFAENRNRDVLSIKDVDFRLGTAGSGRVVVSLPNNQVGVDIRQQGQTLVVEFLKSSLPEGLKRKLDVSDFGTPVQNVTTSQAGDRVRMVIEPKGNWEHSAYQTDNQFVVEVKPQRVDPSKLTQGPGFNGQKLSLNFQNIEVRSLLQVIADFTNFNIVTSDSVAGAVTLRLQDVPWDQALDIILQSKGLGLRKNGNVIWIAPKDEIIAKEKLDREANVAMEGLEPVRTQSFTLNYAKADVVAKGLMGGGAPAGAGGAAASKILSPRGSVIFDTRTNQLFVTDIASKLEQVQDLIAKVDNPVRQVLIEARMVEADDKFSKSLGVRLGGGGTGAVSTSPGGVQFGGTYSATAVGAAAGSLVNLPVAGAAGQFAVSIFDEGATRFLNLEISALETENKGKVVSSPRVVTADKVKAVIEQGTEIPYQVASASGATSIAFRKANLMLEVTPQITPEGNIILELDINKDTLGILTPAGYAVDTKHVKTQVLVDNGGTVMIGGIFTQVESDTINKVPFFGDIPLLGALFRNKATVSNKQEMLVFITPKVIADKSVAR